MVEFELHFLENSNSNNNKTDAEMQSLHIFKEGITAGQHPCGGGVCWGGGPVSVAFGSCPVIEMQKAASDSLFIESCQGIGASRPHACQSD